MSEPNLTEYYSRRAETERALAEKATDPDIARLHRALAERYDAIVARGADTSPKNAR